MPFSRIFVFFLGSYFFSFQANAFEGLSTLPLQKKTNNKQIKSPFNIKAMPAFYWNTIGIEGEAVIKPNITFGTQIMFKWGELQGVNSNFRIRPEDYLKTGLGVDLFARYYFDQTAPVGFYAQATFSYTQMVYEDGNTRPFSLIQHTNDFTNPRNVNDVRLPKPIAFGIGGGYQLPIIPRHRVIANILLGLQGQFNSSNSLFISLYLAPSIGYMFR